MSIAARLNHSTKTSVYRLSLLTLAGFFTLSSLASAAEGIIESYQPKTGILAIKILLEGKWTLRHFTNLTKANIELNGKPIKADQLQPGWKAEIGINFTTLTTCRVKLEWLEATLTAAPTEHGAAVQAKIEDKPVTSVVFYPDMELKGMDDKKPKDLAKDTKVRLYVISGSLPPMVLTFELPKQAAAPHPTSQPAKPTPAPTSQPAS